MATAPIIPQVLSRDGAIITAEAANEDGHTIPNSGRMWIHFLNGSASACEVTVATPGTVDGLAIDELVVDVPAGEDWFIGPFPPDIYNTEKGVTDEITVTVEDHEDMTLAAFILPTV